MTVDAQAVRGPLVDELAARVSGLEDSPDALFAIADELAKEYSGRQAPESVRMLISIARGGLMGPDDGWFGAAQSRYDWAWLAARHDVAVDGGIATDKFLGSPAWFARLDRNRNGAITAEDLDWSERNPWVQHAYAVNRLLRRLDTKGDGTLTRAEWLAFYDSVAGSNDSAALEDLREAWLAGISASFYPGDAPTQQQLLQGFVSSELGSLQEGPQLNDPAPDFTLITQDGRQTIHLARAVADRSDSRSARWNRRC